MNSTSLAVLILAVLGVWLMVDAGIPVEPRTITAQDAKLIRQFLDRYQPAYYHPLLRRFSSDLPEYEDIKPQASWSVSKRNNAEVVNHILKNFGSLDRLGDVGK